MTGLGWMAWTWQTAVFFGFVFGCIALMGVLEWIRPGGHPRKGMTAHQRLLSFGCPCLFRERLTCRTTHSARPRPSQGQSLYLE